MTPRPGPVRVAVLGASGFVGSAVVAELASRPVELRLALRDLSRAPGGVPSMTPVAPTQLVRADLCEPASLDAVCADADVVLHLASYVGPDEVRCQAVNQRGSEELAARVRASAAPGCRIVQLSTCAVYGAGPHRGLEVDKIVPVPVSATSRTRLAGERALRDAGATVLRAALVTGAGDRWVVPTLAELVRRVPTYWDGGRGLLSMVDVTDLARLVVGLALAHASVAQSVAGEVLHAAHPAPVRNRDLLRTLAGLGLVAALPGDGGRPWDWCVERLEASSGAATLRQLSLLGQDHWYRSDSAWRLTGTDPGPGPLTRLAESAAWYRAQLGAVSAPR